MFDIGPAAQEPYDGPVGPNEVRRLERLLPSDSSGSGGSAEAAERDVALMLTADDEEATVLTELIARAVRAASE